MGTRMTIARQRDSSRSRSLAKLWVPISQQHGAYQRCSKNFSACWLDARLFCGGQETKSADGQLVRVAQILSHDNHHIGPFKQECLPISKASRGDRTRTRTSRHTQGTGEQVNGREREPAAETQQWTQTSKQDTRDAHDVSV